MTATAIFAPVWSMIMIGGLAGIPLSVPPLPEDPALARIAPEECLWYMSAAGMAVPDPDSSNKTEQLLAEPQIQQLVSGIEEAIMRAVRRKAESPQELMLATELPNLITTALTRPLALYVADVVPDAAGGPPQLRAGLVVRLGDEADQIEMSIQLLLSAASDLPADARDRSAGEGDWHDIPIPPGAPPVQWGVRDGYLVLGVGADEADAIADRLSAQDRPPAWLTEAKESVPVERRSTFGYVNIAGILQRVRPVLGPEQARIPEYLGLDNVKAIYTTSGLDEVACVSKGLIALEGQPRGLFAMLPHEPLSTDDLSAIPADATTAFALQLNARETLDHVIELVAQFEPGARQEFEEELARAKTNFGIDIREDVLGSLDDTLVVYMPGGELFTAWTGSAAVLKVRDRRRLERTIDKLTTLARVETEREGPPARGPRLRESDFGDYTLHYVQFLGESMPFTPAWCVTDTHLVAGLTPQGVKSAIGRLAEQGDSLRDVEAVAAALRGSARPSMLTYADSPRLARSVYPVLTMVLQAAAGEMSREGFDFDLALLPSLDAIAPHLVPTVSTWGLGPDGYRFETHQSLPGGDVVSSAPVAVALVLPAVQAAREAARRNACRNNLRQLGIALHNHHDVRKRFPAQANYDEDGNPLLSSRVHILPYMGQGHLYEQFHLDEPWDSEHNKKLIPQMPAVYACPSSPLATTEGRSSYVAVVGEGLFMDGKEGINIGGIKDGTSNTIALVEVRAENAPIWTKPEDFRIGKENPAANLGSHHPGVFVALYLDAHVEEITLDIDPQTLWHLFTRAGGEPVRR